MEPSILTVPIGTPNAFDGEGKCHGWWSEMLAAGDWKYAKGLEAAGNDYTDKYIFEYERGRYDHGIRVGVWKRFGVKNTLMCETPYNQQGKRHGNEVGYECDDCSAPYATTVKTFDQDVPSKKEMLISYAVLKESTADEDGLYEATEEWKLFRQKHKKVDDSVPRVTGCNGVTYLVDDVVDSK